MYRNSLRILPVIVLSVATLALLAAVTAATATPNLARIDQPEAASLLAPLLNDNFDYGAATGNLTTTSGGNWVNHSGASPYVGYTTASLSMAGYGSSGVGGAATILTTGSEDVNRSFIAQTSGAVYLAALVNVSTAGAGTYFLHLKNGGTGFRARIFAKNDAGVLRFGLDTSGSTGAYSPAAFSYNTTYLLVTKYTVDTGATALYVLDAFDATEPGTALITATGAVQSVLAVAIRQASGGPAAIIDGVRVANTWADVVGAAPAADLSIVKLGPASVNVSQTFTYTLIATNRISDTARSMVITDAVPLSATIAGVSDDGVAAGHVVSWTIDSVLNGQSITRTIVVTAPPAATTLINSDYGVWAGNYLTRTTGRAVSTQVAASDCGGVFTPTYTVQGSGASSPLIGQAVTLEGVVVGDFQAAAQQSGFYLQDPIGDGNPATSDGVFVYAPGSLEVTVGDAVRLSGTVAEYNDLTEIDSVTALQVCRSGPPLAPAAIDLPGDQECFEGMYVTIPETLTVDQNYFQGRYGQVTLSADGRLYNPTNGNGFSDTVELNARRMVVLDDGSTAQNPNPIPYLGADNTLRAGDVITNLTGVIDYGPINSDTAIRHYRLQPTGPVTFTRANARSAAPDPVGGSIRVASFNVLNYFNGDGAGGGFPTARGANTPVEFNRQRAKIIPAIAALNADVVGLMEIENDGAGALSAIQDSVNGLNAATSAGTYTFVAEPAPGADEIKVALIYQPARVTPQGAALNYQVTTNPDYNPLFDRPPLAQRFRAPDGQEFFVIVNHFKSKGCDGAAGVDADYGQGCWNAKRTAQAAGLLDWITTLQATDPDVIVIGDLNAYGAEDPINTLMAGGLINQAQRVPAATRYSYVFDGQAGYLDQALTTASLDAHIMGVTYWHINADEPSVIDYNTEFKLPDLYTATPYRASDHDPVLIGLGTPTNVSASFKASASHLTPGGLITFTFTLTNSGGLSAMVRLTPTLDVRYFTLSDALDFTPTLRWSGSLPGGESRSVRYAAHVNDLGQLPIGAATIDNAARFDDGAHAPSTLNAPMSITVYGVYVPLLGK